MLHQILPRMLFSIMFLFAQIKTNIVNFVTKLIILLVGAIADSKLKMMKLATWIKRNSFTLWETFIYCPHAGGVNIIYATAAYDDSQQINITAALTFYLHMLNNSMHRQLDSNSSFNIVKFTDFICDRGLVDKAHKNSIRVKIIWYNYKVL